MSGAKPFFQLLFLEIRKKSLNTSIGWLWSLFNPIVQMVIIYFVTTVVFRSQRENLALWLLTTMSTWVAVQSAIIKASNSAVSKRSLILNTRTRLEKIVILDVLSELVILIPFFTLGLVLATFSGINPYRFLYLGPALMIIISFSYVCGLLFASLTPLFRDIPYLIGILLQVIFWISPIISARREVDGLLRTLMDWNPLTYILESVQFVFQNSAWTPLSLMAPLFVCLALLPLAVYSSKQVFRRAVILL